ncbi:MAG TPA: S8 family serine peptidase [Pyrinomonadaceae bacterium]|nr:S8 family serine peptidase [Pyrinomonadaceae bacterium]
MLPGPASLVARAQFEQNPSQTAADAFEAKADKRLWRIRRAAAESVSAPTRVARERAAEEVEKLGAAAGVSRAASGEVRVGLLVQLKGEDASELRDAGFDVGAVVGDVATVEAEASRLGELAELGSVVKLSAATQQHPLNDRARRSVGIDNASAQRVVGQTGAGVVVGVIDSGIDFRHKDFTRPGTNGTQTRIKYLLDMTAYGGSTSGWDYTLPGGSAPIGKLYTEAQINAAIAAGKPAQASDSVRQRDKSGHGTHVAGTAAGNGLGAPSAPGVYAGMAPDADLIIVKAARQDTGSVSFREDDTVNGLNFILTKAAELNEPFVANMSLGGQAGPHDGTSLEERAIDTIVGGGPGRVVCVAAGNEGDASLHAKTTVPEGGSVTLDFNAVSGPQFVDLYYNVSNRLTVTVTKPNGTTVGPLAFNGAKISDADFDLYNFLDTKNDGPSSNDQPDIFIDFGSSAPAGVYHITLQDADGVANAPFDAWGDTTDGSFTNFVDNDSHLVASPGTARGAITVGAFVTRSASQTIGNFAPFTSPGPTADGRLKPEISAPGYYLYSTRSSDVTNTGQYTYGTGDNALATGVSQSDYGGFAGTSMSTPVTTGSVALLLQLNRNLTADQVKTLIINSAAHDSFTGTGWNSRFGNGKLNIAGAITAAGGSNSSNPIDDPTFFVTQHYHDFLNRDPDSGGLAFWVNQMTNCASPPPADPLVCKVNVSAAFFLSIEFQETGFYAIRINRAAFNRRSDSGATRMTFGEVIAAQQQIGAGVVVGQTGFQQVLDNNKNAYAAQTVASSQFAAQYPQATADTFVDALYATAGLSPTVAERTAAINAYNNPGSVGAANSRAAALRVVADSNTVRSAELNTAYVLMEYVGYLRRTPDTDGYNFWLTKLNQFNGDAIAAEMVKAFITSTEYRARFGTP